MDRCGSNLSTQAAWQHGSIPTFACGSSFLILCLLGEPTFVVDAGWGADSAGAWGPSAHLEPPAAPTHFTNTEQPYVEHVTTTALPHGSELTGQHSLPQSFGACLT